MSNKERNKRLGQYFTGKELAKVLFEIAVKINPKITSAIDPMMGKGDMLTAVNEKDNFISTYGIEIDRQLKSKLTSRLKKNNRIIFGNTFEKSTRIH